MRYLSVSSLSIALIIFLGLIAGVRAADAPVRQPAQKSPADAMRIVIVVDPGPAMTKVLATAKGQIGALVTDLPADRQFNIIAFRARFDALSPELLTGSDQNKDKAAKFLEKLDVRGKTNPLPGIEEAFRQKPDLIYLIASGSFPDNDAVLKRIRVLNKDQKVAIFAIGLFPKDIDKGLQQLFRTLASESGGRARFVAAD